MSALLDGSPSPSPDTTRAKTTMAMDMSYNHLAQLPEELLQETLEFVDIHSLLRFARTCGWAYQKSMPFVWRDVELVDCRTRHLDMPYHSDEHDDSPIIKKLIVLARNPWLASLVQNLSHRCHLPPPALFSELPKTSFKSRLLSHDPRTLLLLERACANLINVQALTILFGHWHITKGLLTGILDKSRKRNKPLRKLWIESCDLSRIFAPALSNFDLRGLQSIRLRRLPLLSSTGQASKQQVFSRGRSSQALQDGRGWIYNTTTEQYARQESIFDSLFESSGTESYPRVLEDWEKLFEDAHIYDDIIYSKILADTDGDLQEFTNDRWDHKARIDHHLKHPHDVAYSCFDSIVDHFQALPATLAILRAASSTLVSLNLDWIFLRESIGQLPGDYRKPFDALRDIFRLRFPCLRAFQVRNTVVRETQLPRGLFLLDECSTASVRFEESAPSDICISFIEAHSNLRCLAWPIDCFFDSSKKQRSERVTNIISSLGQSLVELRLDAMYDPKSEFLTEKAPAGASKNRRLFISEFASKMHRVEHLKIEGTIPRDERRETIRAMGKCPLSKIVLIGVNSPVGNTWGLYGKDIEPLGINEDFADLNDFETLEEEDVEAIAQLGAIKPEGPTQPFQAEYGWPPSAPLIHNIAAYHADTVTELKFCGYRGAPLLWDATPITGLIYSPLRHFHKLKSLILSLWLQTIYEDEFRDDEVIASWLDTRYASSTALVAPADLPLTGWAKQLSDRFVPLTIVTRMKDAVGPWLSERAKAQKGGVHIRGSFCIGTYGGIFDFDAWVGKAPNGEDALLDWRGPREELEPNRRCEKFDRRRWF